MKYPLHTDTTVTYEDATEIIGKTEHRNGMELIHELFCQEPAIAGYALRCAAHLRRKLERMGATPEIAEVAVSASLHTQAVVVELHRQGARKLWSDLIEGGSNE